MDQIFYPSTCNTALHACLPINNNSRASSSSLVTNILVLSTIACISNPTLSTPSRVWLTGRDLLYLWVCELWIWIEVNFIIVRTIPHHTRVRFKWIKEQCTSVIHYTCEWMKDSSSIESYYCLVGLTPYKSGI